MTFFYNRRPSKAAKMTDLQLLTYLFELLDMETGEARTAAHTALNRYNDLSTILSLPRETLLQDPNLSEDCRSFLALIGAMVHRYAHRFRRSDLVVADKETVLRLIRPCLENSKKERVCAICVDEELHLLGSGAVTAHGTEDSAALPIQRLLALALASEAKGMILDFVEVMACPGGCVGGGGQPIHDGKELAFERGKNLYYLDENAEIRFSHENPDILQMYEEFFEKPVSHKAHMLLHTDHLDSMERYGIGYKK